VKFTFEIRPDGQPPFRAVGSSRDISTWEKTTKGASLGKLQEDMSVTALYQIAFHTCRRQGLWAGTLAEFEANCDIDNIDDDDQDDDDPSPSAA